MLTVYTGIRSMSLTLTYNCAAPYTSWAPPYSTYLIPGFQVNSVVSPSMRYTNTASCIWWSSWTQPSLSTTLNLILSNMVLLHRVVKKHVCANGVHDYDHLYWLLKDSCTKGHALNSRSFYLSCAMHLTAVPYSLVTPTQLMKPDTY